MRLLCLDERRQLELSVRIKYMNSSKQSKGAALLTKNLQIKYWVVLTMMGVMTEDLDEDRGTTRGVY